MPKLSMRVLGMCAVALSGCSDKYEMVTAALMTDPPSTGIDTTDGATTGGTGGQQPTSGGPGGADTDSDPTVATTGPSATCDTPEACTAEGQGDVGPLTLPFFRGEVCVSDKVQPGDKVAVSISSCVHPCLAVNGFKFKSVFRGTDAGLEMALAYYHPDTTGLGCPSDVFGEFPAEACVFVPATTLGIGPVIANDTPYAGPGTLLVPFFTNEDVGAFNSGDDAADAVWQRISSHMQASERSFVVSLDPGNAAAPAECGPGVDGCTCKSIGL